MKKGFFIVFEGIDGAGKSTQISLLADYLTYSGYPVLLTREPTDGKYGQQIRKLYTERDKFSLDDELELFVNDRREHVEQVIAPALAKGKVVLCDRYYFSTAAYQGAAGGDIEHIFRMNSFAPEPDLLLLLVVPPEKSVMRIENSRQGKADDFEKLDYLLKVANNYQSFKHDFIKKIDASLELKDVQSNIRGIVTEKLPNL